MAPPTIRESAFSADVVEFIRLCQRFALRYLVVGGEAVIFHGYPRLTGHIDFFYERRPANAERLFQALEIFWDHNIPGLRAAKELLEPGVIIQFGRAPNRIDLHNQTTGVSFAKAWKSRVVVHLETNSGQLSLRYLGIGLLQLNKRATARARDLDDLEHLTVLTKGPQRRTRRKGLNNDKRRIRKNFGGRL